ncbi:ankyrin repeat domain-containing protein 31-like isoform X2 [Pseudoliparis swirei]|uniref:ankyrin repeat domain-containing protein 31-like isoform X2 n=1 Tax=Pseudoliparis swirei TaxID=2059687 RepID=UPI0024BDB834|nr:ankyrin repeat domain-containing protein 31-like isoform X2 [Pseudoliparis swirei]
MTWPAAKVSRCVTTPMKTQLNKRNGMGETLLHIACKREDLAQVKALIQAGIDINTEDNAGWTALHEASACGNKAVVEELLKVGSNVHARNIDGVTALHDAVYAEHHQVVKLLIQYGSNPTDKNLAGLSALDMAEKDDMRELLSLPASSVADGQPCEARHRPPGHVSSEAHWLIRNDPAKVRPRDSCERDEARQPGDIQPGSKDPTANDRQSEALTVVLEEVVRKQMEISAWPLIVPDDAGRYHAALTQIQRVVSEVLTKQQLEKDNLARRYSSLPDFFRQRLLKNQVVSLASRQRTVLEILQKQMRLVEVYVSMKAKLSTQPPNCEGSSDVWPQQQAATPSTSKARGYNQSGEESHRPVAQTAVVRSTPPNKAQGRPARRPPAPPLTQRKKKDAEKQNNSLNRKPSSCRSSATQAGNNPGHVNFLTKGNNALIQTQADNNSAHLSQLVQRGVLPAGSALQLLLKGSWHLAHVQGDGLIKDAKGKSHRAPERWLESILGNNIPVSSTYAWDKVTFGDKPLSHYLLNADAVEDALQTSHEVDVQHGSAGSSPEELTPEAASLRRLMRIKIIRLVDDDEMLPNAIVDRYWEELLRKDYLESEDWNAELF